jgi:hypothetical protein
MPLVPFDSFPYRNSTPREHLIEEMPKKLFKRPVNSLFSSDPEGILNHPSLSGVGSITKGEER